MLPRVTEDYNHLADDEIVRMPELDGVIELALILAKRPNGRCSLARLSGRNVTASVRQGAVLGWIRVESGQVKLTAAGREVVRLHDEAMMRGERLEMVRPADA